MLRLRVDPQRAMRCRECGREATAAELGAGAFLTCSLRGIRHGPAGDREPDEFVRVCDDCGARESYDPAPVCAECLERPCICE